MMRASLVVALLALFVAVAGVEASPPLAGAPISEDGVQCILWMSGVENAYPHWSKDGERVLFQSNRAGKWQLYVMKADGSQSRVILGDAFNDNFPDWSPDNSRIAFVSDRSGNEDVWIMDANGRNLRNLTNAPGRDIHPFWTPDGSRILFNSTRGTDGHFDVYSMKPDGTDLRAVRRDEDEKTCARLSPARDSIVYLKGVRALHNDEIFVMSADGTGDHNVTRSAAAEGWPTWTSEGTRILFSRSIEGQFVLYTMRRDGGDLRRITSPPRGTYDARANLSPDGKKIIFNRQVGRTIGIFVLPFDY